MTPNDAHHAFWDSAQLPALIDGLVERGWYVGERFLAAELCRELLEELQLLHRQAALQEAAIGRGDERMLRRDIRGDAIHWLDRESLAQRRYLALMSELQQQINLALYAGLFEFEAHFAHYPPGAFYRKHYDSFRGRANRVISTVLYLNPDWPADGGGEMALYDEHEPEREVARVHPEAGTFACFLSDRIPHEVLPTRQPRVSIAGWFRRNASLGGVIDPAR
ncbi:MULTISPECIES: 2OG-Fe(II) oxygenase [Salinicola]|jgi:SM-20-related protein|uniref:2OG-Fe(II) oxygenase n=1 Tax=Salinicola TaxID=404432 RepID=UPI0008DDF478|nr:MULTISPECIES: 2OG-Fe(II) oxygenase [Salinicola]MDF3918827.1 2OG-Fe(II) oxygenase [Salinicola salarius]MEC8918137.1 2OG-Fe(II) oxygenase [Pseudomonadota bacterium]OHZ03508.1 2OG-Fe(II) oxygenase [Salinicola sp. MIT1003]